MSASPQKHSIRQQISEVVIYSESSRLPRLGFSASERASSSPGSSQSKATATRNGSDAWPSQDMEQDAAFVGLTRIEQIRLRARRKAEEEDRKQQEAEAAEAAARRRVNDVTGDGDDGSDDGIDDDDEDEDEELADVVVRSKPSTNGTASGMGIGLENSSLLSSAPTLISPDMAISSSIERQRVPISPLLDDGSDDDNTMLDPTPSYDASRSASQESTGLTPTQAVSASQRTRRSTARVEPYVFRPSLEPLSDRRKLLQVAKQSAAVQAKLIDKGHYRGTLSTEKGDLIERAFRDHRRDKRTGMDAESLMRTVQMAQAGMKRLQETTESNNTLDRGEVEEVLETNDDTSLDSSSESENEGRISKTKDDKDEEAVTSAKRVKFAYTPPRKERLAERKRFARLLGNASDDEDGAELFDMLQRDRETLTDYSNGQPGDSDSGTQWSIWRKGRPDMVLDPFPHDAMAHGVKEFVKNEALFIVLLDSHLLLDYVKDYQRLANWVFRSAVLSATGEFAYAAMQFLIRNLSSTESNELRKTILDVIPSLLLQLGSREAVISFCFAGGKGASSSAPAASRSRSRRTSKATRKQQMRRGDRWRAVDRLLQIVQAVVQSMGKEEIGTSGLSNLMSLFLFLIHLGLDRGVGRMIMQVDRLLATTLELIHRSGVNEEVTDSLAAQILSMLKDEPPSIRAAILDRIPSVTISSRSFQRRLAYRALLFSSGGEVEGRREDGGEDIVDFDNDISDGRVDLLRLSDMLESRDGSTNPVLATESRDYLSVDANLKLLWFIFNDLALQILELPTQKGVRGGEGKAAETAAAAKGEEIVGEKNAATRKAGAVLLRVLSAYRHEAQPHDESRQETDDDPTNDTIELRKIEAIHKIINSLRSIGGNIQDGKGAFLDRSKVKDHLQRLHLMLTYELVYFGLESTLNGDSKGYQQQKDMKQRSLSSYLQKERQLKE